jgi:HK97 family phage major capsid protein/HK97 family phage prohead protease
MTTETKARTRPPRDNLVRAFSPGIEFRAALADGGLGTLSGHFSVFNAWYEVDSLWEGRFLERVAPGAFKKTFAENRDKIRVTFNHGQDPDLGDKVLGPITALSEDGVGAAYELELLDGLPPLLLNGLRRGVYGSSFRFRVVKEEWDDVPKASEDNPSALPERTIKEVDVFEFGPVTFPASPTASAAVRSLTDIYAMRQFTRDPARMAELLEASRETALPDDGADEGHSDEGAAATPAEPDEPAPQPPAAAPPPDEPATEPEDPPEGGSSDSRSATVDIADLKTTDEIRARFDELNGTLKDQHAKYPGVMPEDEQVKFDADTDERDKLGKHLKAWEARQAVLIEAAKKGTGTEPGEDRGVPKDYSDRTVIRTKTDAELHSPESRSATFEGRTAEYRDDAKRLLEKVSFPTDWVDAQRSRDRISDLLDHHDSPDGELARRVKYTSSPAYERAFHKFITSRGQTLGFTLEEQRGTALAVGVDATGGFAVPFAFDPTVIAIGVNNGAVNPYRATCRVVSIVGTDTWNAVTATAVVATRTTEAAPSVEQGPTFAQPQYVVKRAQGQITASFEMFQDRSDLASELGSLIQEAKDNEEETSWAVGAGGATASIGVGPVSGTSGAFTAQAGAGAGVLAEVDFTTTESALPVRHRFTAQWFMNRVNIRKAQSLETTGGKLFGGSAYPNVGNIALSGVGNTGLRLLGYPVNESPSLPTATTTTITAATLCNVNQYVIVDRVGLSVQFIPFIFNSSALATGQQALYFLYRNHAAPLNVDAGRTLRFL